MALLILITLGLVHDISAVSRTGLMKLTTEVMTFAVNQI